MFTSVHIRTCQNGIQHNILKEVPTPSHQLRTSYVSMSVVRVLAYMPNCRYSYPRESHPLPVVIEVPANCLLITHNVIKLNLTSATSSVYSSSVWHHYVIKYGVKQGCCLSPNLLVSFLNDKVIKFNRME